MAFISPTRVLALLLATGYGVASAPGAVEDAGASYARAEALLREHQWDPGLKIVLQMLQTDPKNPKLLNLAGLACTGKGDWLHADEYFEATLEVRPGFVPALKNLAINEFDLRQFKPAEQHLELASRGAPDDPVIHLYLGQIAYRQRDFHRAATELAGAGKLVYGNRDIFSQLTVSYLKIGDKDHALASLDALAPEVLSPPSRFSLGLALAKSGLPARAVPYFESLQQSYPAASDIGYDLALCYLAAKQFPQAIGVTQNLIQRGPETAELENVLAEAYEGNKQTQPAIDALRRAIALDPADDANYLDFAALCINHHAYTEAAKVLEVALASHPRSASLYFERGILNATLDHYDDAEKDFAQSTALAPEDNSGLIGLGLAYLETGNAAQAIPVLRKRLHESPTDAKLLYLLGEALLRTGVKQGDPAFKEAQESLEKSVRLDPTLALAHVSLGTMYLNESRNQDAVTQLEQARLLDPSEQSAYSHLAIAYRRLGQQDKAREILSFLRDINDQARANPGQRMRNQSDGSAITGPGTSN